MRTSQDKFSPAALSTLVTEIGFVCDEIVAAAALLETKDGMQQSKNVVTETKASDMKENSPITPALLNMVKQISVDFSQITSNRTYIPADDLKIPKISVKMTRDEFIEFMAHSAISSGLNESSIKEYLQVFYLLHLSGIREQAGVSSVRDSK